MLDLLVVAMQLVHLGFVVTWGLVIRSAAAEPVPAAATQSVLPGVLSTAVGVTVDARIDFTHIDILWEIPRLSALNLHGQYIAPSGVGVYLAMPIAVLMPEGEDRELLLGNLQLGGIRALHRGDLDMYVRAGLALEQTNGNEPGVELANLVPNPADLFATGSGTSWWRAGAGLRLTSGSLVVGGAGGVDVPFDSGEWTPEGVLHLSGSIGISRPQFGLAMGVTMLQLLGAWEADDNLVGLQAIGDLPVGRKARLYGAFGFNLEEALCFSIGAGVRIRM